MSYSCSQPCPHRMQANEYASCTVSTGARGIGASEVGLEVPEGVPVRDVWLMPTPSVVSHQWTPVGTGAHRSRSHHGRDLGPPWRGGLTDAPRFTFQASPLPH